MSNVRERVRALESAVEGDAEATARANDLLSAIRHDLGNLIGTFTMEAHLLGHMLPLLERALAEGDLAAARQRLGELRETSVNLNEAGERARAFLSSLRRPETP